MKRKLVTLYQLNYQDIKETTNQLLQIHFEAVESVRVIDTTEQKLKHHHHYYYHHHCFIMVC